MNDKKRIAQLEFIVCETLWMARRYAHNRRTFSPTIVNECIDMATGELGLIIKEDTVDGIDKYADDGDLGKWVNGKFQKE